MAVFVGIVCFLGGMFVGGLLLACIALAAAVGKKDGDNNDR